MSILWIRRTDIRPWMLSREGSADPAESGATPALPGVIEGD
ncbi:MAG: hypothetical protein WD468_08130 [Pirellulales bacterium]